MKALRSLMNWDALQIPGMNDSPTDVMFVAWILPPRLEWAKVLSKDYAKIFPKYKVLASFLEERVQTLLISAGEPSVKGRSQPPSSEGQSSKGAKGSKSQWSQQRSHGASAHFAPNNGSKNNKRRPKCAMCNESHYIG